MKNANHTLREEEKALITMYRSIGDMGKARVMRYLRGEYEDVQEEARKQREKFSIV